MFVDGKPNQPHEINKQEWPVNGDLENIGKCEKPARYKREHNIFP